MIELLNDQIYSNLHSVLLILEVSWALIISLLWHQQRYQCMKALAIFFVSETCTLNSAMIILLRKNFPNRKEASLRKPILFPQIHDALGRLFTLHNSSLKVQCPKFSHWQNLRTRETSLHFERFWWWKSVSCAVLLCAIVCIVAMGNLFLLKQL